MWKFPELRYNAVHTSIKASISGFSQSDELRPTTLSSCTDESWPLPISAVSETDLLGSCGGGGGGEGQATGIFTVERRPMLMVFVKVWFILVDVPGVAATGAVAGGALSPETSLSFLRDLYAAEMASGSLPQCLSSTRAFWQNALSSNNPLLTATLTRSASLMNCFSAMQRVSTLCRAAVGGCMNNTHNTAQQTFHTK